MPARNGNLNKHTAGSRRKTAARLHAGTWSNSIHSFHLLEDSGTIAYGMKDNHYSFFPCLMTSVLQPKGYFGNFTIYIATDASKSISICSSTKTTLVSASNCSSHNFCTKAWKTWTSIRKFLLQRLSCPIKSSLTQKPLLVLMYVWVSY